MIYPRDVKTCDTSRGHCVSWALENDSYRLSLHRLKRIPELRDNEERRWDRSVARGGELKLRSRTVDRGRSRPVGLAVRKYYISY